MLLVSLSLMPRKRFDFAICGSTTPLVLQPAVWLGTSVQLCEACQQLDFNMIVIDPGIHSTTITSVD
jgi:hypothetical protein